MLVSLQRYRCLKETEKSWYLRVKYHLTARQLKNLACTDHESNRCNLSSTGSQGYSNVSHGCINVSTSNGQWFYDNSKRGDIVEIVNTVGSTLPGTDGLGDWNIPWEQWKEGNANV